MPLPFPEMLFASDPIPPVGGMSLWFDFSDPDTFNLIDGTKATKDTPASAHIYSLWDKSAQYGSNNNRQPRDAVVMPIKTNKGWHYLGRNDANAINGKSVLYSEGISLMTGNWANFTDQTIFVLYKLAPNLNNGSRLPIFGQMTYNTGEPTYSPLVWGKDSNLWTKTPSGALVSNQPFLSSYGWKRLRHEKEDIYRVSNWVGSMSGGGYPLSVDPMYDTYKVGYTLGGELTPPYMDTANNTVSGYYAEIIAYDRLLSTSEMDSIGSYLVQKWGGNNPNFGS